MTPSEIADWLELEADTLAHVAGLAGDAPHLRQAAATIRELEALITKRIKAHQETLDRERVALTKLKIATEALKKITGDIYDEEEASEETIAAIALARIKETK